MGECEASRSAASSRERTGNAHASDPTDEGQLEYTMIGLAKGRTFEDLYPIIPCVGHEAFL